MVVESAILARVSDESTKRTKTKSEQAILRSKSVDEQLEAGRKAAARLDWHVPANFEFTDIDISASSFAKKERPGWLEMRRLIDAGFIRGVIIWAVNRASREIEDWSGFLNLCRRRGVLIHVISYDRTYDCTNAHDIKNLLDDGIDGWYDSERKSVDVRRGVNGAKAAGKPLAKTAIGYKRVRDPDNGKLLNFEIEEAGAAKIRTMFQMLDDGHTVVETARAVGFIRQQVRHSARHLTYIAKRRMPDGTLVDCIWPPLIDEDQFWRVQAIMDGHHGAKTRPGAYRTLLSYIATCAKCGDVVAPHNNKNGDASYRCKDAGCVVIPIERADSAVTFEILKELIQPGVLERYLPRGTESEAVRAESEASRLRAELNDWLEAGVSAQAYKRKEDELTPLITAAESRARAARASASVATLAIGQFIEAIDPLTGEQSEAATAERLNKAIEVWESLPLQTARDLLRETVVIRFHPRRDVPPGLAGAYVRKGGTVAPGQIEITWQDPDEVDQTVTNGY